MAQSEGVPLDHSFRCASGIRSIKVAATCRGSVHPLHELDIPVVVKVPRTHSLACDELLVPAGIVVVGGVQRLMQVANKVEKELQSQEPLGIAGGGIAELGRELIDLVDHAGLRRAFRSRDARRKRRMAKTRCGKIRLRQFDVHEVPPPCRFVTDLSRVAVAVAIDVGPCRLARDVVAGQSVGVGSEQLRDLGAGRRLEIVLGDKGNDFMTLVAPSERGTRAGRRESEKKASKKKRL
jgi:hypothetical protein